MFSSNQEPSPESDPRSMGREKTKLLELQDSLLGKHFDRNHQDSAASTKLVDSVLAKEFNMLSVQERSKTYEELHGVNDCVEETPVFLHNSLRQLDEALMRIEDKPAYETAVLQNKAYVTNPTFRLMFLRADGFHPEKAATRMVAFFEGKLQYFGESLLTKRIQFSDLHDDIQACVKAGHMQLLPSRDRSDRPVFTYLNSCKDQSYKTPGNRLRASIYFWLTLAEDEENQKRGLVVIAIHMGSIDLRRANPTLAREHPRIMSWLPIRVCALHCCTDDSLTACFFRVALVGAPADIRARHRFHIGTYTELMYSLLSYGIPVDLLPLSESGAIKKTTLNRWIARCIARDLQLSYGGVFSGVDLPTRNDVLMGKGKPIQLHPGNVNLRLLVEDYIDEYQDANLSLDKMSIVYKVISMIHARHGRFLQKDHDGWWRESANEDALDKIRKTFQRTNKKETLLGDGRVQAQSHVRDNYVSMLLQQGKRPRCNAGSCGT